jgi:hypothetical protein
MKHHAAMMIQGQKTRAKTTALSGCILNPPHVRVDELGEDLAELIGFEAEDDEDTVALIRRILDGPPPRALLGTVSRPLEGTSLLTQWAYPSVPVIDHKTRSRIDSSLDWLRILGGRTDSDNRCIHDEDTTSGNDRYHLYARSA